MAFNFQESFELLQTKISFDAVQLLKLSRSGRPLELYRKGYGANTAWALAHMFPLKEPGGFTRYASAEAPLPPTISSSNVRGEFTTSKLFREHLSKEGYADGMTLELLSAEGPIGLVHFSSQTPRAFDLDSRMVALAVSGFLALLALLYPDSRSQNWSDSSDPRLEEALTRDSAFVEHLRSFQNSPLSFMEHLWWIEDLLVEIVMVQPGKFKTRLISEDSYFGLTRQELNVLSVLCCGVSDAEIAKRLHLSIRTVQSHITSLRYRIQADSRLKAVVVALGSGLYIPDPKTAPLSELARGKIERRL